MNMILAGPLLAEGQGGVAAPPDQLSQINQVCGLRIFIIQRIVFFTLSYFDCSDLQLFAIFMAGKSVAPRYVQMVRKTKQNPLLRLACTICTVHSR